MPGLFDNEDSVFVSKKIDLLSKMLAYEASWENEMSVLNGCRNCFEKIRECFHLTL